MLHEQDFWDYAVNLYGQSGVTDICLKLQDNLGLNVNLLLLLCYAEEHKQQLSGIDIELLVNCIYRWHEEYTKPLRQIRRRLALEDSATMEAKRAIFDAEMELEKAEQRLLVGAFNRIEPHKVEQAQNLQRYIGRTDRKAPLEYGAAIEQLRAIYQ